MASTAVDWAKLKVVDLKAELKSRGLSVAGRKDELIARLVESDGAGEGDEATADAPAAADAPGAENGEAANAEADTPKQTTSEEPDAPDAPDAPDEPAVEPMSAPEQPAVISSEEVAQDSQKRKRESVTPPPTSQNAYGVDMDEPNGGGVSTKRQRVEEDDEMQDRTTGDEEKMENATSTEAGFVEQDTPMAMGNHSTRSSPAPSLSKPTSAAVENDILIGSPTERAAVTDTKTLPDELPDAPPNDLPHAPQSIHPATTAVYIRNLMRPLRPVHLDGHLTNLAASGNGGGGSDALLLRTYLDPIRSHAFAVFRTVAAAARVRAALHGHVWPDERNRRALWVDFVPPEAVDGWIATEQGADGERRPSGRDQKKWEVVYGETADGEVAAVLREVGAPGSAGADDNLRIFNESFGEPVTAGEPDTAMDFYAKPPAAAAVGRSPPPAGAPRGPRGADGAAYDDRQVNDYRDREDNFRRGGGDGGGGGGGSQARGYRTTRTGPAIDYRPVPDELGRRRQAAIRKLEAPSYQAEGPRGPVSNKDYSKIHNRYTFEDGDVLVDRGPEKFNGIRPPHRERERRDREIREGRDHGSGRPPLPPLSPPRRMPDGPRKRNRRNRHGGGGGRGGFARRYDDYRPAYRGGRMDNWDSRDGRGGRDNRDNGKYRESQEGRLGGYRDEGRW